MDGVLVHEDVALPGGPEFIAKPRAEEVPFQILTNNSIYTPPDLAARLRLSGIDVEADAIWPSALTTALYEKGYILTDVNPDYVVLGETRTYSFEAITRAIRLIGNGARFIATNPDVTGPSGQGPLPATGSVAALITAATGRKPYF